MAGKTTPDASGKARRPKGANGQGGLTQLADGRWRFRVQANDGTRIAAEGRTQEAARTRCMDRLALHEKGIDPTQARQTLGAYLETWLSDVVRPTLAPKTHASYRDTVRKHIVPTLGRIRLDKLTPAHVQALIRAKQGEALSARSVSYIRTVLVIALNRAVKWNMVERNVAALTDAPRETKVERQPMTPEQARTFLRAARGDRLEGLYVLTAALGLRLGEGLGLRWSDVDLDAGTIRIRQTVQRVDGRLLVKEPKTEKSRRTLTLPATVAAALRRQRDRQALERKQAQHAGRAWADTDLVFTNTQGGLLEPSNVLARFKRTLAAAGLPPQRFHDLRHYAASFYLAQGVPPRVLMDLLGHSQIATTMDIYAHVMPAAHREAADHFDRAMAAEG